MNWTFFLLLFGGLFLAFVIDTALDMIADKKRAPRKSGTPKRKKEKQNAFQRDCNK